MILLDTSLLLAIALDNPISPEARRVIAAAAAGGDLVASAVSGWEVGLIATTTGRTGPRIGNARQFIDTIVRQTGLQILPLDMASAVAAAYLPEPFHRDPADRLLVATARTHDATFVTSDRRILAYADAGHVTALAA